MEPKKGFDSLVKKEDFGLEPDPFQDDSCDILEFEINKYKSSMFAFVVACMGVVLVLLIAYFSAI